MMYTEWPLTCKTCKVLEFEVVGEKSGNGKRQGKCVLDLVVCNMMDRKQKGAEFQYMYNDSLKNIAISC